MEIENCIPNISIPSNIKNYLTRCLLLHENRSISFTTEQYCTCYCIHGKLFIKTDTSEKQLILYKLPKFIKQMYYCATNIRINELNISLGLLKKLKLSLLKGKKSFDLKHKKERIVYCGKVLLYLKDKNEKIGIIIEINSIWLDKFFGFGKCYCPNEIILSNSFDKNTQFHKLSKNMYEIIWLILNINDILDDIKSKIIKFLILIIQNQT